LKILVEIEFLETVFPPKQVRHFMNCLKEIESGQMKYGTIELSISPGPEGTPIISRVKQVKQFER